MWPDVRRTVNCNRTGTAEVKFQLIFSGSGLTMTEMAHRVCVLLSFISFTESPDFSRMIYLAASVPSFFFILFLGNLLLSFSGILPVPFSFFISKIISDPFQEVANLCSENVFSCILWL